MNESQQLIQVISALRNEIEALKNQIANPKADKALMRLLDQNNLELESYEIAVSTSGEKVDVSKTTKQEHKRVIGVFVGYQNGSHSKTLSTLRLEVNNEYVFSRDHMPFYLFEKTDSTSFDEVAWKVDIPVSVSPVEIQFIDADTFSTAYKVYVYLICEKK